MWVGLVAPVADNVTGKIFFLSSPDNWFQRVIESSDDGQSFTPWAQATDLDASLRKPGWGLVFNGLPGNARIKNVGKSQSCMVSKLPIIWQAAFSWRARTPMRGG